MITDNTKEELKTPERKISADEQAVEFKKEGEQIIEKKEISPDEKVIADELRREIEMMESDDTLKDEAKKKAQKIEFLGEEEKIEHLLKIAREKGVVFAIKMAKEMKEPYILDVLHDILAREGFYKKMGQATDDDTAGDNKN
jgi:hypothetical protein